MGLFGRKTEAAAPAARHSINLDGVVHMVTDVVDCIGDSCPRPQLMTKKAVGALPAGGIVEVLVDNPTSMEALGPLCPGLGAVHLATVKDARCWRVYIRKN